MEANYVYKKSEMEKNNLKRIGNIKRLADEGDVFLFSSYVRFYLYLMRIAKIVFYAIAIPQN